MNGRIFAALCTPLVAVVWFLAAYARFIEHLVGGRKDG